MALVHGESYELHMRNVAIILKRHSKTPEMK
jgi:hypothetical protein